MDDPNPAAPHLPDTLKTRHRRYSKPLTPTKHHRRRTPRHSTPAAYAPPTKNKFHENMSFNRLGQYHPLFDGTRDSRLRDHTPPNTPTDHKAPRTKTLPTDLTLGNKASSAQPLPLGANHQFTHILNPRCLGTIAISNQTSWKMSVSPSRLPIRSGGHHRLHIQKKTPAFREELPSTKTTKTNKSAKHKCFTGGSTPHPPTSVAQRPPQGKKHAEGASERAFCPTTRLPTHTPRHMSPHKASGSTTLRLIGPPLGRKKKQ